MRCPCCSQSIHRGAEECPHCGGDLAVLDILYKGCEQRVRRPHDVAGVLRIQQRRVVADWIEGVERAFPDLFIGVALVALADAEDVRSYGFWLLNRGEFEGRREGASDDGGVLLVMDVNKKEVCLHFGYLMDEVVEEREVFDVLTKAHPYLLESDYMRALDAMLGGLKGYLKKLSRDARRLGGGKGGAR